MNTKIRERLSLQALVLTLISFTASGQITDLVQTDGIIPPLNKANIGRIIYRNGNIPLDQLKETDFLTSFALKPASDLNIRVSLGNSITNYLHSLSPASTEKELRHPPGRQNDSGLYTSGCSSINYYKSTNT